jgi:hypothetical protein
VPWPTVAAGIKKSLGGFLQCPFEPVRRSSSLVRPLLQASIAQMCLKHGAWICRDSVAGVQSCPAPAAQQQSVKSRAEVEHGGMRVVEGLRCSGPGPCRCAVEQQNEVRSSDYPLRFYTLHNIPLNWRIARGSMAGISSGSRTEVRQSWKLKLIEQ